MKVLIIGGNRFVGKSIVELAVLHGHDITVISTDPPPMRHAVQWIHARRQDFALIKDYISGQYFDVIIDNIAFHAEDVKSTLSIIAGHAKRYVLTSSVDVYGTSRTGIGLIRPGHPHNVNASSDMYSYGKSLCEYELLNSPIDIEKVIIRPSIITGRNDIVMPTKNFVGNVPRSLFFPARVVDGFPIILSQELANLPFNLSLVDDAAAAILLVALHPLACGKVFNISSNEVYTCETLINLLASYYGSTTEVLNLPHATVRDRLPEYRAPYNFAHSINLWNIYDNSDLIELGWTPTPFKAMAYKLFENLDSIVEKVQLTRPAEIKVALSIFHPGRLLPIRVIKQSGTCTSELSSVGIGTYGGNIAQEDDDKYLASLTSSISHGINVIDTAITYRSQRSEQVVGHFIDQQDRSSIFLISKGGFAVSGILTSGLHNYEKLRNHSIRHAYIGQSLSYSLTNLKTKIDCYLIHNVELGKNHYNDDNFYTELVYTFSLLERKVEEGVIGSYGIATWHGLRVDRDNQFFVDLEKVLFCAQLAAGKYCKHNFSAIELPINPVKTEAIYLKNQVLNSSPVSTLEFAKYHKLKVFASDSVMSGKAIHSMGTLNASQTSLNFVRSVPGVTSALVGMRQIKHTLDAKDVLLLPKFTNDEMTEIMKLYGSVDIP